jgi:hypothetical protein
LQNVDDAPIPQELWFEQYLDHFNLYSNPQTWQQRYLLNDDYWNGSYPNGCAGPSMFDFVIFLCLCLLYVCFALYLLNGDYWHGSYHLVQVCLSLFYVYLCFCLCFYLGFICVFVFFSFKK